MQKGLEILDEAESRLQELSNLADSTRREELGSRLTQVRHFLALARAAWRSDAEPPPVLETNCEAIWQLEKERARLAQLLRARVGRLLADAATELAACLPFLGAAVPRAVYDGLVALEAELREGLADAQWLLTELRHPLLLSDLGLASSLCRYAALYAERFRLVVTTDLKQTPDHLPREVEVAIFRILQDALRNAHQHARAQRVSLTCQREGRNWAFRVTDDGRGFDPDQLEETPGLDSMREWARLLGGELTVHSVPGQGTQVTLIVPETVAGRRSGDQ